MFSARTNWSLKPNRLNLELTKRRERGLPVLDLTESNPTRCGLGSGEEEIHAAYADVRAATYEPDPRGPLAAREAITHYYDEHGASVNPEQIFLTSSTSEAYSYVFRLLADARDEILTPRPSYPLFEFLSGLNDVVAVPYHLRYSHGWQIDQEFLRTRITPRTRAAVVVHPNNPTGSFVSLEERRLLLEIARANKIAIVSDEVFLDFTWTRDSEYADTHAGMTGVLTLVLSGLSKISALPQMKLAWIVASGPPDLLKPALERLEVIADTYLSVSPPLALCLPRWIELRRIIQPRILERVKKNRDYLDEQIRDSVITRLQAGGGWYAVVKLPTIKTDEDWAIQFLTEEGVLTHPGHFYDFLSDGYLVISLLPEAAIFEEGMGRMVNAVQARL